MKIRGYDTADWARLCAIHDAARKDELAAAQLSAAFLSLEETAENEGLFGGEVLVCEADDGVRGFVAFAAGELTWLYVDPAAYGRGIGRQLLRAAIARCKGSMSTEVLVGNERALSLYLSEGFTLVKRVDGRLAGNESFAASGYVLERAGGHDDATESDGDHVPRA